LVPAPSSDTASDVAWIDEAVEGDTALAAAPLVPEVVMDVKMSGPDGIATPAEHRRRCPDCAVVVLSVHDSEAARVRAGEAGAAAVVGKHELDGPFLAAIRRAIWSGRG
jgi:two-component system response regulator NreC